VVVYTAIFNAYDRPLPAGRGCPHVLFTDAPVRAPGWDVRIVPRRFTNAARENRFYKLSPHRLFPGERVIYHDGGMRLRVPPESVLQCFQAHAGGDHSIFTLRHSLGHVMRDEFAWVRRKGITSPAVLDAQEREYRAAGMPFDAPVAEARLIISRPDAGAFFDAWWAEVERFSHRDQVSFPYAWWSTAADVHLVPYQLARAHFKLRPHVRPQLQGVA